MGDGEVARQAASQPGADLTETAPVVVHVVAPAAFGGLETVVHALASGQARRGASIYCAAIVAEGSASSPREPPPLVDKLREARVIVQEIVVPPRASIAERRHVRTLLRLLRPDVVHTHGYRADVLHGSLALSLGLPTVSTVHGFVGGDRKNRFYEALERRALRRHDAVVCVSRPLLDELAASGASPARLHHIANAWACDDSPIDRAAARARLGLPTDARVLGWIGRLSTEKGADILITALARTKETDAIACLIGDGPERAALQELAHRSGVSSRVRLVGAVPQAARLLRAFDAVVLSSRREGTPMVLLEAMSAGVPIVATRVGGIPDVVSPDEALVVEPNDPEALARAFLELRADPVSSIRRAANAAARLRANHAIDPWLDAYDRVYRAVLKREVPPRSPPAASATSGASPGTRR